MDKTIPTPIEIAKRLLPPYVKNGTAIPLIGIIPLIPKAFIKNEKAINNPTPNDIK